MRNRPKVNARLVALRNEMSARAAFFTPKNRTFRRMLRFRMQRYRTLRRKLHYRPS